jgi:hypothetical protein
MQQAFSFAAQRRAVQPRSCENDIDRSGKRSSKMPDLERTGRGVGWNRWLARCLFYQSSAQ